MGDFAHERFDGNAVLLCYGCIDFDKGRGRRGNVGGEGVGKIVEAFCIGFYAAFSREVGYGAKFGCACIMI